MKEELKDQRDEIELDIIVQYNNYCNSHNEHLTLTVWLMNRLIDEYIEE